jgi:hypothetical protein
MRCYGSHQLQYNPGRYYITIALERRVGGKGACACCDVHPTMNAAMSIITMKRLRASRCIPPCRFQH